MINFIVGAALGTLFGFLIATVLIAAKRGGGT